MSTASDPLGPVLNDALGVHEAKFKWGDATPADLIAAGVEHIGENPNAIMTEKDEDGNWINYSVWDVIPDHMSLPNAMRRLRNRADNIGDGVNKRDVMAHASGKYLSAKGEFFQTLDGTVYYFYNDEHTVYRVTGDGQQEVTQEFRALVGELTGLSTGRDGRTCLVQIADEASRQCPEREAHKFAAWDEDDSILYVTDFDDGYYRLDGDTIEHRNNGDDVFFLGFDGDAYEYLEPSERTNFPNRVPGELDKWHQNGDLLMRFFGNRTNFDPAAILAEDQQRKQMYVHLHAMAFIDFFTAKPITAFVGEKGSGKTVIQRSVGKFLFGDEWKESMMPSDREDFAAIVSNRPLAFVDNFDKSVDWANDILASTATGSADIRRELYTTMGMAKTTPDCFIALTSRDPPFRRDDVADRTVVFRVSRLDSFIGMRGFLNPVTRNRDSLWSTYLDNLNDIIDEMQDTNMEAMVSSHRMSDWAGFAKVVADAMDIDGVDEMLEVMQQERALFALEDDSLFRTLREWMNDKSGEVRGVEYTAGDLLDELQEYANNQNIEFTYQRAQTLGKRLGNVAEELDELFGFTIHSDGRTNKYEFIDPNAASGRQGMLGWDEFEDEDDDDSDGDGGADDDGDDDGGSGGDGTPDEPTNGSDGGTNDDEAPEPPEPDPTPETTQQQRMDDVGQFIANKESEFDSGVPRNVIVTMLSSGDYTEKQVKETLDNMLQRGFIYEPNTEDEYLTT